MKHYDYIAIGGGSAGIASANRAAEYGKKALIVEENEVGGTCVNVGCVPKKIMWYGAQLNEDIDRFGPAYGIHVDNKRLDFAELKASRQAYIDRVHKSYFSGFESRGTDFIQGHAEFVDNHTIRVNGEDIQGDHIAIVTGGRPALPDLPGIDLVDVSDDIFTWEQLPESVAIIGAGYIAVEFAGVLNGLGVDTTLAVRHDRPLRQYDQTIIETLTEEMTAAGVNLLTEHNVAEIKESNQKLEVKFQEGDTLEVDRVIYAIGRQPNTDKLGLENTDIQLDDKGYIQVDDYHFTDVPGLYAFGDVIGKVELTPVAIKAGRTLSDHLFNGADKFLIDYDMIPTVIFAHPPIGTIGYSEAAAKEKFGDDQVKCYRSNFADMYSAASTNNRRKVTMKLVVVGEEERVVGLHGIGFGMDEILQGFAVAVTMGANKAQFDQTIAIHPTGAEEFVTMR